MIFSIIPLVFVVTTAMQAMPSAAVQAPAVAQSLPGASGTTLSSAASPSETTPASTTISTRAIGLDIRLLPLGDSITWGATSSDGNGSRSALHDLLQPGNTLDFIGSMKSGTMVDNDNEGHPGAIISQIAQFAKNPLALPARPNVVLLAGTNDMHGHASGAPARLSTLIDNIFTTCPDAALIVATLTPRPSFQEQVDAYNQAITQMINTRQAAGQHILVASMASVLDSDLSDGIHPTDIGYTKMASAWFPVVELAAINGWIGKPVTV